MKIQDTRELAELANRAADGSRYRDSAPHLTETSSAEWVARWLQWNDPNGSHTAELAESEGCDPYTTESAWDALAEVLLDEDRH